MKSMLYLLLLSTSSFLVAQTSHPATHAGATNNTVHLSSPSGKAISACGSITSPGDYYLSRSISCPGTALLLSGPGIHLNLNGYTVTYGTAGGAMGAVYGIENDACWDTEQAARTVPCDNKSGGVGAEVYGGMVVQSSKAPAFSHAFFFGENNNSNQVINIHNVTIGIQQPGTIAFLCKFQHGQILFEHNTIYDYVKSINQPGQSDTGARSDFQGEAIFVDNSVDMAYPDRIDNNKIIGSPQGGIRDTSNNATVYENDISQNSTYANDFCIDVPGTGEQIYSNYCHPVNGRGIHVNGENSHVYNNDLVVTEAPIIPEYHGCEGGGAFAIQVEHDIKAAGNTVITGNKGTLNTGDCGGAAFRITNWPSGAAATVQGNTWTVNKTAGTNKFGSVLYSVDASNLSAVKFGGDTLHTTGQYCAGIDWDGGENFAASLASCNAPHALAVVSAPGISDSFKITGAPNTSVVCGLQTTATGTVNGAPVRCAR